VLPTKVLQRRFKIGTFFVVGWFLLSPVFAFPNGVAADVRGPTQFANLDERIKQLETKVQSRHNWIYVTGCVAVLGLILSIINFRLARSDRRSDKKIKSFETLYEAALQSSLERLEACGSELRTAAEFAEPKERSEKVKEIWVNDFIPGHTALTGHLRNLDESSNVSGNSWAACADNPFDALAKSIDVLLDVERKPAEVAIATETFACSLRELGEAIRTEIIHYKILLN